MPREVFDWIPKRRFQEHIILLQWIEGKRIIKNVDKVTNDLTSKRPKKGCQKQQGLVLQRPVLYTHAPANARIFGLSFRYHPEFSKYCNRSECCVPVYIAPGVYDERK